MRFSFAITMAYLKKILFLKEVAKDKVNRRYTIYVQVVALFPMTFIKLGFGVIEVTHGGRSQKNLPNLGFCFCDMTKNG